MQAVIIGLVGIFVALLVLATVIALLRPRNADDGIEAKPILTANELEFFFRLQRSLPDYFVFPQVALNAMLRVSHAVPKQRRGAIRNRFSQKHADYVVCARSDLAVVAIVELDDRTHSAEKDALRDRMVEAAGYRVVRFHSKRKPSEAEIAAAVLGASQAAPDVAGHDSF